MSTPQRTRKDRIASLASKRPPSPGVVTYWLTRDCAVDGRLSDRVDVWLARPERRVLPGGVGCVWICDDVRTVNVTAGDVPSRWSQWTVQQCLVTCRVFPETDRECIHVGGVETERSKAKA